MTETAALHNTIAPSPAALQAESAANTVALTQEAQSEFARVGYREPEAFAAEVEQRAAEVAGRQHTSINMSTDSLDRMFSEGGHHAAWNHHAEVGGDVDSMRGGTTTQGKDFHDGYFEGRAAVEQHLAGFVEDPGKGQPVYAATASGNKEELFGACPEYGSVAVILDESKVDPKSTVYSVGDSLAGVGEGAAEPVMPKVVAKEDVPTAKAVVDMTNAYNRRFQRSGVGGPVMFGPGDQEKLVSNRASYVETVLFQEVTPDTVQAVCVSGDSDTMADAAETFSRHPEAADKAIFVVEEGGPQTEMVKDYLAGHYSVAEVDSRGQAVQREPNLERWQAAGADMAADPATVSRQLQEATTKAFAANPALRRMKMKAGMAVPKGHQDKLGATLDTMQPQVEASGDPEAQATYATVRELHATSKFFDRMAARAEQHAPVAEPAQPALALAA
jgi:hypothetical protein